ncbi:alpha/beta hydrolase fold domain-containing protein [Chitinophaga sp. CF418]|uniref:alpha/beta hydrolase fold domain-containing protein n=1 Tax=Chitinophaga sp. CF418 TaxID=1855287 RepID=UPI00165F0C91|nr:alpha/beta hydrolase [Chitinophaga sp. CF418]
MRLINKKGFLGRQLRTGRFNRFDCAEPPSSLFGNVTKIKQDGQNVFTLEAVGGGSNIHILYLHGGAYVQRFTLLHWLFLSDLIKATGVGITAPDYPLAPAYTYKEAFTMVEAVYKQLTTKYDASRLILMGDSAGGGFALALAQKLKKDNVPVPARIILLSPWLDISLENPVINSLDPADPFLGVESLRQVGKLYAGGTGTDNHLLSPINGPLTGLGKIAVFAGANEILVADARKLKELALSQGTDLEYYEYPDMVHAWMLLDFPESKQAKRQIIDLIKATDQTR